MNSNSLDLSDVAASLVERAPDGIIVTDADGCIRLINAQAERLFGYERQELIGKRIEVLVPRSVRSGHVCDRTGYQRDPHVRPMGAGLDLHGLRKDGSEVPVEISLSPLSDSTDGLVVSAIRDISERKSVERQLRRLNVDLERANRTKDEFLAAMSHELRTPLNAIIGFTGTLLMGLPGPLTEEQERQMRIVQTSARHLLSLISDILDVAKAEAGKMEPFLEPVSLRAIVEDVAASLATAAAEKGLQLVTEPFAGDDVVTTDRRAVRQILLNLVDNAVKYTPAGTVRIRIEDVRNARGAELAIAVSDTGIGIGVEDRARLFEAFERLDEGNRRSPGTGLGLYLSKRLVELLGGDVAVRSELGHGSTFTLILPAKGAP